MVEIEIDKITNSIELVATGEKFETVVLRILPSEIAQIKKSHWLFDWKTEVMTAQREVFKLVIAEKPKLMQGLVSMEDRGDHIFMHLIESGKMNRGARKQYAGVAGNLFAFACKRSFECGYQGVVSFHSKTQLVSHYETTIGAKRFAGNRMYLDTPQAKELVRRYFKQ